MSERNSFMGRRITVIGGDLRQITVAESLAKDGFDVSVFGFDKKYVPSTLTIAPTLAEAVSECKAAVLGIAPCKDSLIIDTPYSNESVSAHSLISLLPPGSTIIGGKLSSDFTDLCVEKSIRTEDFVNRDDFAVLNAVPTAEGAIAIAMEQLPITLHGSKCLITGFGRIGKILARDLHFLGADVTCSARKSSDLAWISALGYEPLHTSSVRSAVHHFDLIFNTEAFAPAK